MSAKRTILYAFVLVGLAASTSLAAKAETLDFTLTGGPDTVTFSLPSSPVPTAYNSDGFTLDNVVVDANGIDQLTDIDFYTSASNGGIGLASDLYDFYGAQLFTGTTADPTFETGSFPLTLEGLYNANLDITPAPVPEPSSIFLLASGVLALLGAGSMKRFAGEGGLLR